MDAFESLISSLLEHEGYWTRTSFKVELTKEKKAIGRESVPRWELDVVAYKPLQRRADRRRLQVLLDSRGVRLSGFDGSDKRLSSRYKLFNDPTLRTAVLSRLALQLCEPLSL